MEYMTKYFYHSRLAGNKKERKEDLLLQNTMHHFALYPV